MNQGHHSSPYGSIQEGFALQKSWSLRRGIRANKSTGKINYHSSPYGYILARRVARRDLRGGFNRQTKFTMLRPMGKPLQECFWRSRRGLQGTKKNHHASPYRYTLALRVWPLPSVQCDSVHFPVYTVRIFFLSTSLCTLLGKIF